jgi:hypothetical protein
MWSGGSGSLFGNKLGTMIVFILVALAVGYSVYWVLSS